MVATESGAAQSLKALLRQVKRRSRSLIDENDTARKTIRKLRAKNAKLEARIRQLESGGSASAVARCSRCRNVVDADEPDGACIYHTGIFYDVEGDGRELDSDSETFGMWSCCEAEERDAIGCKKGRHKVLLKREPSSES
ncbi:DNA endonuclease activator Ctp1 C-terminal domain-containing protein [Plasmodiophora brassicae]|uniref:Uncharacterized protein n=1 Tax=Plasmodiophora brassicae TaxID=37360 RepID=A0A0G4J0X7_PLABS|nr:hypothetical protein PBRA_001879 [Plasmodiophora brassicae]SPR01310.1 unnamed protein product [Plasmodiophora brassicae]